MAVIADGRIRLEGAPAGLIERTRGHLWTRTIERTEIDAYRARYEIISTRLFAGRSVIHVLSDHDPGDGFTAVEGSLEDVYFTTLTQSRKAA
jgi:hypothetical protein